MGHRLKKVRIVMMRVMVIGYQPVEEGRTAILMRATEGSEDKSLDFMLCNNSMDDRNSSYVAIHLFDFFQPLTLTALRPDYTY